MCNYTSIFMYKFCCPITYMSKTLNCECFTWYSWSCIFNLIQKRLSIQQFLNNIINTKPCTFITTRNTSLAYQFSSTTRFRINIILPVDILVSILNPSHNLFISAHIRSKTINTRTNKSFFYQLHCISSSYSLKLCLW